MMRLRRINKVLLAFACGIAFCWACGTATAAVSSNPLKVVLVGDSYSAGNGAGDYYGPKGCYRSTSNWAEKYLDTLRAVRNVTFVNRACSGGVLNDVTQRRLQDDKTVTVFVPGTVDKDDASARQALDARGSCKTSYRDDEEYDIEAVSAAPSVPVAGTNVTFKCTRYMQPQANAIGRDTDLVLFTIGGNDVDFEQIVRQCFVVGVRDPSDCEDRVSAAQAEIGGVSARITGLLRNLKSRMRPDAKIALVAYPYLEKNPDFELRGEFLFLKTYAVGREVRRLGDMGDAGQRAAVNEVNGEAGPRVSFLDELKPHFAGHEPDGRACCRNDDRWVHEFDTFTPMEWYHFNGTGHSEVARLLSQRPDIGVGSAPVASGGSVDIAFVIDTTGSMGTAIDSVKAAATELVDTVAARTASARYALVDYRDFVERTGSPGDYPAKLQQDFTSSSATINAAIQGLALGDGGDSPETMYSGMNRAYELTWRPGVKKLVIVLADAPPLSPEPISGLTKEDMIQRALAIDPVEAQFVDISGHAGTADVSEIAARTNGAIHRSAPSEAAAEIAAVIETSLNQPYAWAGGPYVARAGDTVVLDGRGSYGVASDIVKWEWDIGADGNYEYTSDQPQTSHTYAAPFDGLIGLRVTDADGRTGLATVVGHASADGDEIADADDNCPAVDNRDQEDYDTDGIGDACDPTPGRPTTDIEGVTDNGRGTPAAPTPDPATPPDPARPPDPTPAPGSPQTVPGPAAKKKRADVRIGAPRLTANGKRVIVRLSCSRRSGACRGTIRGTLSGRSFKATYRIAARRGKIMRLKVPAGAQRSFARGSRLTLRLVTTAADGVKSSRTAKLRLRRSR